MASALFYSVAVLYHGTIGYSGSDVFLAPLMGTAVFAAVIALPVLAGWLVSRRHGSGRERDRGSYAFLRH